MKRIRLTLLALVCVAIFSGCQYHAKVGTANPPALPENWEAMVKKKMKSLAPFGSIERVVVRGTPQRCTYDFETRQYGYCGTVDIIGGQPKDYFISESNVVWHRTVNGLEMLP